MLNKLVDARRADVKLYIRRQIRYSLRFFFLCKSQICGTSLSINPAALSKNSRLQMTNQNNTDGHKKRFYEADNGNMVLTATAHNDSVSFLSRTRSSSWLSDTRSSASVRFRFPLWAFTLVH